MRMRKETGEANLESVRKRLEVNWPWFVWNTNLNQINLRDFCGVIGRDRTICGTGA